MHMRIIVLLILLTIAAGAVPALSQTGTISPKIISLAHSSNWEDRADAMQRLAVKDTPASRDALMDLLSRENAIALAAIRERGGTDAKYGEGYGEYLANLSAAVQQFADRSQYRQRALGLLLDSPCYPPEGAFVRWLASHGSLLLPDAQKMEQDSLGMNREIGIGIMTEMLRQNKTGRIHLNPDQVEQIHNTIMTAVTNNDPDVKWEAIQGLKVIGGPKADAMLRNIATRDPTYVKAVGTYPLRDEATELLSEKPSPQE